MNIKKQLPELLINKERFKKQQFAIGSNEKATSYKRGKMSKIAFVIKLSE
jgi:hypothetical protein